MPRRSQAAGSIGLDQGVRGSVRRLLGTAGTAKNTAQHCGAGCPLQLYYYTTKLQVLRTQRSAG